MVDPDWPVPGVSAGSLTPPFGILGAVTRAGGGTLAPSELAVTASWGHGGHGRPVMPGQGRLTERSAYTADEMIELDRAATARGEAVGDLAARLGPPIDVWLNDVAYWRTVPRSVWDFTIGGYQVFKKALFRARDRHRQAVTRQRHEEGNPSRARPGGRATPSGNRAGRVTPRSRKACEGITG